MRSGLCRQVIAGLVRSGNRCVDGERRAGPRASGGQVDNFTEGTWQKRRGSKTDCDIMTQVALKKKKEKETLI